MSRSFKKLVNLFVNNFNIVHLGFIFQRTKSKLLFVSRFCCVACQIMYSDAKNNVFRGIFSYGQFLSQRALKNQLPSFLILFSSCFQVAFLSRRILNHCLYLYFTLQSSKQCTSSQKLKSCQF